MSYGGRGLKGAMKHADKSGARWAIIVGETELAEGNVQLKDLASGSQRSVAMNQIVAEILTGE
jgi:histidyl-tRNA synthetase